MSTRFAYKILSAVFNYDQTEIAANPVHLMYVLEQRIAREDLPDDTRRRYLEYIKGYLAPRYAEFIGKEIQTAYLESYSEYGQNIFDRYVTYADCWIQEEDYRDPETGEIFDRGGAQRRAREDRKAGRHRQSEGLPQRDRQFRAAGARQQQRPQPGVEQLRETARSDREEDVLEHRGPAAGDLLQREGVGGRTARSTRTSSRAWWPRATPRSRCACWPSGICACTSRRDRCQGDDGRSGMLQLIDRRLNSRSKSAVNRERFLRRYKTHIQDAGEGDDRRASSRRHGAAAATSACRRRTSPSRRSRFGRGGDREFVLPGNREYVAGDRIPRPDGGGGARRQRRRGRRRRQRRRVRLLAVARRVHAASSSTISSCRTSRAPRSAAPSRRRASARDSRSRRARQPARRSHADAIAGAADRARRQSRSAKSRLLEAAFACRGRGRRRRIKPPTSIAELERIERRRGRLPFLDEPDLRYRNRVWRAGADRARGDVLPDGRLGVDGRGQEGPRQALLHAAVPVPDPQVRRSGPGLHPPHRRRGGSRRGHVLPRHAVRRHRRLLRAGAGGQDPRRALRARTGTSTSRRPPTATRSAPIPPAARASCASACCPRRATTRISNWRRRRPRITRRRCGPSTSAWPRRPQNFAMRRAMQRDRDLSGVPRAVPKGRSSEAAAMSPISHGADWDFDLLERYDGVIAKTAARVRARHLSEPDRDHHLRADAGRLRVERAADRLSALVVRQGVHPQRAGVSARHAGPGLRDRHQLQSVHRVPDGGEHDGDAGAGDRARVLRPQLLLQGQLPVPAVDRRRRRSSTTSCSRGAT